MSRCYGYFVVARDGKLMKRLRSFPGATLCNELAGEAGKVVKPVRVDKSEWNAHRAGDVLPKYVF